MRPGSAERTRDVKRHEVIALVADILRPEETKVLAEYTHKPELGKKPGEQYLAAACALLVALRHKGYGEAIIEIYLRNFPFGYMLPELYQDVIKLATPTQLTTLQNLHLM